MNYLIKISLRNLLRQKRRNILLGIGIAVGMMILVMANSFSAGITDILMNKIITYITGHIQISMITSNGRIVFREKERMYKILEENLKDYLYFQETVTSYCQAIGNGRNDSVPLIGVEPKGFLENFVKLKEGDPSNFTNKVIENPLIIPEDKAKYLKVKLMDTIKVRFPNIYGQIQAASLTVIGISKSDNPFLGMAMFCPLENMKNLMGYRPYEASSIQIVLKNPLTSVKQAMELQKALKPELAYIDGKILSKNDSAEAFTIGFSQEDSNIKLLTNNIHIVEGRFSESTIKEGVFISLSLANKLKLKVGDTIKNVYRNKLEKGNTTNTYVIDGIFDSAGLLPDNTLLLSEKLFYYTYYSYLPKNISKPGTNEIKLPLSYVLTKEWIMLPRPGSTDEMNKQTKELKNKKTEAAFIRVITMYEAASQVLQLEKALNLISLAAVMVLFFIILIGIINTLRMTIKERTREIGTIRSIGMRKNDVKNLFLLETFFLVFFACIVGIIASLLLMGILSRLKFNIEGILSILLLNKHLHFVINPLGVFSNMILILLIALATAFFPARRAADLSCVEALRHYE